MVAIADPGPRATPEQAQQANEEALALFRALLPLNLPRAADVVRSAPPSPEAIAMLAFVAHDLMMRLGQRERAARPRGGPTPEQVEQFRRQYLGRNGKDRGWKTAACLHFGCQLATLNKRI